MAKTQQGIETKRLLLKCSSELFYEHGFNKTKMQAIADRTGITIGSIGYYFRRKEDIAGELLRIYISKFYRYIMRNSSNRLDNFTLHTTASLPYYKNIYNNDRIKRFYYELITSGSLHSDVNSTSSFRVMMNNLNNKMAEENGIELDDFQKTLLTIYNSGGRNSLIIKIMEGFFKEEEIDHVINFIMKGVGSVIGIPRDKINKAIDYSIEFNEIHKEELGKIQVLDI